MTLELLSVFGKSFLFVLAAMLPILNPAATAPIFLSLTEGAAQRTRTLLARRIALNMFWLMAASMLVGSYVLDFFGISLPIVRIGGGLILAAMAWRLLNATPDSMDSQAALADSFTPERARKQAFYPLTFPISCGPGSIAVAITVGVTLHDTKLLFSLARMGGALLAVLLIGVLMYLAFRYAARFLHLLGDSGAAVFVRMSAFILLCLGVQIVWDGVSELIFEVARTIPVHGAG
jgi:multiple antibiotic resistance protein